ncbi:hypothetical protein FPV67DRAFT_1669427 [Lyophyllum atratum]|nr:hypothetical protein FPV67DRAFT_1669427 [Lyophyllum atratum]
MDQPSNTFAYITGAIALFGSLTSVVLYCRNYFPSVQMTVLQEVYQETKEYYEIVRREGLVPPSYAEHVEVDLKELEYAMISLLEATWKCKTSLQEITAAFQGLSTTIARVVSKVKRLRDKIVTVSEEQRRARRQVTVDSCMQDNSGSGVPMITVHGLACDSVVSGGILSFLPAINVPSRPGCEARSLVTGFLSYGHGGNDQVSAPHPASGSDPASTTETLVGPSSGLRAVRLWLPFKRWGWSMTKAKPGDVESCSIQDDGVANSDVAA